MIRAFVICAMLVLMNRAIAEDSAAPTPEPTPVSACNNPECETAKQQQPSPRCDSRCQKKIEQQALLQQKIAELNCLQTEIDELRRSTGTPQQVLVRVQALEISRTKLRELGTDLSLSSDDKTAKKPAQASLQLQNSNGGFGVVDDGESFLAFIEALQQKNVAKVLAEPSLVVVSGRPAAFNVGGEFPIPSPPGSQQAVDFQPFGTKVDVLAVAQGDNRVRLELRFRVSERDDSRSVEIEGTRVPALHVRQFDSTVELEYGQTGLLTGLVQRRTELRQTEAGNENVDHEVELLFVVTPESVSTVAAIPTLSSPATTDRPR